MSLWIIVFALMALLPACSFTTKNAQPGTVIILNGTSAVGKSSIQKELQELLDEPYLKLGIDQLFVGVLPQKYLTGTSSNPEQVWETATTKTIDGRPIFNLKFGPAGQKMISGMHQAIAAYARTGNNVIVDYILYDSTWLAELKKILNGIRVYFVGVHAPLEVIEQREKDRATSPQGHARSIYDTVHAGCSYDLFIDTTQTNPTQAAHMIKEFIEKNPTPQAFKS